MSEGLRDVALREFATETSPLLEALSDFAKVPIDTRQLFKNLIISAAVPEWYVEGSVPEPAGARLDQVIGLAEKFRSALKSPPNALLKNAELFDRPLGDYASMVEEFLVVAAHVKADEEYRARRPRGGQRRSGSNRRQFEVFAEKVYRAALQSKGRLSLNKNATADSRLAKGSFADVLALLRPHLPPRLIPKALPMGTLHRIKRQVDDETCQVA